MNSGHAQHSGVLKREAFVPGWAKGIQRLDTVGSTQEQAKILAEGGAPEGTTVMAEAQTGGRGRMGRKWHSPTAKESG